MDDLSDRLARQAAYRKAGKRALKKANAEAMAQGKEEADPGRVRSLTRRFIKEAKIDDGRL